MLSLEAFINKKIKSYVPPEKEGIPRGKRIGFSREKYHASLLLLSTDSLKEIAKKLDCSYGSIRNWKTEKEFNGLTQRLADEFAEIFIETLMKKRKKRHREINELIKKPLEEIADLSMGKVDVKGLMGVENKFSKYLTSTINLHVFTQFVELRGWLMSKSGIEEAKIPKLLFALYGERNRKIQKKYSKPVKITLRLQEIIGYITMLEELLSAVTVLKKKMEVKPKKVSSKKKKEEVIGIDTSEEIREIQLSVARTILLRGKTIKERDRKLAVVLLSRVIQILK